MRHKKKVIHLGVVMFNLNTRNYENMVLAESAEFAESNLKADPTLRELRGLCAKPFEIAFLSEFTVLKRYFPGSRHVQLEHPKP